MGLMVFAIGQMVLWFVAQYAKQFFTVGPFGVLYAVWQIMLCVGYITWTFERGKK